jgi:translation initiation factor 2B subunit (eIF-2B alpha/beta/delta family)
VDRTLRRELDAIRRDTRSGAAELTLRGVAALQAWLERRGPLQQAELLEVACALLDAQPSMAPLVRLANQAALAADAADPRRSFGLSLSEFRSMLRTAPRRIARHFAQALRPGGRTVATYSYSSTVLHALQHSRKRIARVLCSESRPGNEGRVTARQLAGAGIEVVLMTDAALLSQLPRADLFLSGADAIAHFGFVNKVGTQALVMRARRAHIQVWVLADTSKFLPCRGQPAQPAGGLLRFRESDGLHRSPEIGQLARSHNVADRPRREVWPGAPEGVEILNPYFELVEFFPGLRLLTEKGRMSPADVRETLKKIRVSPRLQALGG